jgi:Flp pilus assembly protein TadG
MGKEPAMTGKRRRSSECDGSSLVEVALVIPICLLLFAGAVDIGQAFYVLTQVAAAAHAGAVYGVENPGDISGMESAAKGGSESIANLSASVTYGCECSDGSSASVSCTDTPSCTYNYVNYVDVVASATYSPFYSYAWIPSTLTFAREARMRTGGE